MQMSVWALELKSLSYQIAQVLRNPPSGVGQYRRRSALVMTRLKRQSAGTNGCDVGQEDADIPRET